MIKTAKQTKYLSSKKEINYQQIKQRRKISLNYDSTIQQTKNNKEECTKAFSELFIINIISTGFSLISYILLILYIDKSLLSNPLHIIFASLILMCSCNIEWLFQGFEEYKYIAIRSLIIKAISFALLVIFVRDDSDILLYALIICFGTVGNYFLNIIRAKKKNLAQALG